MIRALAVAAVLLLVGCAAAPTSTVTSLPRRPGETRVLVLTPEVLLYEYPLGGPVQRRTDWASVASPLVAAELDRALTARALTPVHLERDPADPALLGQEQQLAGVLRRVAHAVFLAQVMQSREFVRYWANKPSALDQGVGDAAKPLAGAAGAEYVLSVGIHETFTTNERKAVAALANTVGVLSSVAGAVISGADPGGPLLEMDAAGSQTAHAVLIDAMTGKVIWSGSLDRMGADVRTPEGAADAVDALLATGFPA
jgi:hypothetical protein